MEACACESKASERPPSGSLQTNDTHSSGRTLDSTQTALWFYVRSASDNRLAVNRTRADTGSPEDPAGKGDADVCYQRNVHSAR